MTSFSARVLLSFAVLTSACVGEAEPVDLPLFSSPSAILESEAWCAPGGAECQTDVRYLFDAQVDLCDFSQELRDHYSDMTIHVDDCVSTDLVLRLSGEAMTLQVVVDSEAADSDGGVVGVMTIVNNQGSDGGVSGCL